MELNNEKRASHKERGPGLKDAGNGWVKKREGRSIRICAWFVPTWDSCRRVKERIGSASLEGTSGVGTYLSASGATLPYCLSLSFFSFSLFAFFFEREAIALKVKPMTNHRSH